MKTKHKKAYMDCAKAFSECSCSTIRLVGSVIVKNNRIISCGYNALPGHLNGPLEDHNGVTKPEVRHAEKNALIGLTKSSESSIGATMFCTASCCKMCAIDIVDAGILKFIYREEYRDLSGLYHLLGAGVEVEKFIEDENSYSFNTVSIGYVDAISREDNKSF